MATRREWLARAAAASLALQWAWVRQALAQKKLASGVARARGGPLVNGAPATQGMSVRPGDAIATPTGAELVFVAGRDAFLVRENTRIETQGAAGAVALQGLRILTGALLSVFAPGEPRRLQSPTAVIGIRGSAVYVESEPQRTYVCTCYGTAELAAADDPAAREVVTTRRHDEPRYVMAKGAPQMLMKAPVVNHTDAELVFLESLVGRTPPFAAQPGYKPGRY